MPAVLYYPPESRLATLPSRPVLFTGVRGRSHATPFWGMGNARISNGHPAGFAGDSGVGCCVSWEVGLVGRGKSKSVRSHTNFERPAERWVNQGGITCFAWSSFFMMFCQFSTTRGSNPLSAANSLKNFLRFSMRSQYPFGLVRSCRVIGATFCQWGGEVALELLSVFQKERVFWAASLPFHSFCLFWSVIVFIANVFSCFLSFPFVTWRWDARQSFFPIQQNVIPRQLRSDPIETWHIGLFAPKKKAAVPETYDVSNFGIPPLYKFGGAWCSIKQDPTRP